MGVGGIIPYAAVEITTRDGCQRHHIDMLVAIGDRGRGTREREPVGGAQAVPRGPRSSVVVGPPVIYHAVIRDDILKAGAAGCLCLGRGNAGQEGWNDREEGGNRRPDEETCGGEGRGGIPLLCARGFRACHL